MYTKLVLGSLSVVLMATACSKDAVPPQTPAGSNEASTTEGTAALSEPTTSSPNRGELAISDRIRKACGITETDTYFDFDSTVISHSADRVLEKLATCFTTGPLAGQGMKLVGHADPRGDSEYNLLLGGRRADHVSAALAKKGLGSEKMTSTSRGEMDASGDSEASWARDRKVEVMLRDE